MNHHHHHLYKTAAAAIAKNKVHTCTAAGCSKPRRGISLYCSSHLPAVQRYGHWSARPIPSSRYEVERNEVAALAAGNAAHPAFVQALAYVQQWMAKAAANESAYKGAEQVARLVREGVPAEMLLIEVAALWSHLQAHERLLPDDKARDFALSRAVIALAPLPRRVTYSATNKSSEYSLRPRTSALSHIGKHLREVLALFLANVHQAVITRHERAAAALEAMRAPLSVNVPQLMEEEVKPTPRCFRHIEGMAR
jgi:hypothetical protein